jgi:hypothetical protein
MSVDWHQARSICQAHQSDLATISNMDENMAVAHAIRGYAWIGLNDISAEGNFVWANGDLSSFSNFFFGEPNDLGSENCVNAYGHGTGISYWNDYKCEYPAAGFLCSQVTVS